MQNSAKKREKSGKFGKIRENRENSVKFGKIQENSGRTGEEPVKCRGSAGEEPGKSRGRAGEEPGNRKFRQKTENFAKKNRGMDFIEFDVESGNLSVSAQFFVVLARFCCFCAFLARFCCVCAFFGSFLLLLCLFCAVLLNFHDFGEFSRISGSFGRKCR